VAAIVGDVFATGLAATALGGILQAQIAFVPQHVHIEIDTHALPPVSITPVVGPGAIGIVGTF
jgi:hypothetical protein